MMLLFTRNAVVASVFVLMQLYEQGYSTPAFEGNWGLTSQLGIEEQ